MQADRINDYFYNAIIIYAFLNEEDAMFAAFTAAKVAARKQRASMAAMLERMASDIPSMYQKYADENATFDELLDTMDISYRLLVLKKEIEAKDWNLNDIRVAKAALMLINEEYAHALDICDPKVFLRKHPNFTKLLIA